MSPEEILSQDQMIEFLSTHELDENSWGEGWGCEECGRLLCSCDDLCLRGE